MDSGMYDFVIWEVTYQYFGLSLIPDSCRLNIASSPVQIVEGGKSRRM